jgi:hypothetical protein
MRVIRVISGQIKARMPKTTANSPLNRKTHQFFVKIANIFNLLQRLLFSLIGMTILLIVYYTKLVPIKSKELRKCP